MDLPPGPAHVVAMANPDDPVLSLILSKAALLVADHKVTDPTIVSQLGHRAR